MDKDEKKYDNTITDETSDKIEAVSKVASVYEKKKKPVLETDSLQIEKERKKKEKREQKVELKQVKEIKKHTNKQAKRLAKVENTYERFLSISESGLSNAQVQQRIDEGLVNVSLSGSTKSLKKILVTNIFTFFNMLMIAIAIWLITIQSWRDLVFMVVVSANIVIGIIQEIKAKKTIDRLSLISAPTALVVREGEEKEIPISDLVLDDIMIMENGKQICADSIVLDGAIEVNESLLTGESDAVIKKSGDILYSGSFVVSGKCSARVDKVGKDNYIETLTSRAKLYKKPKSDLLRSLNIIIRVMAGIIIPIGGFLFYFQYFKQGVLYNTAVSATAGAMIGMIPSGLYLLTSVALAIGVIKLSERNVLVQELYCIEMLARINVLCLDKTGTITDGTMSVKSVAELNPVQGLTSRAVISAMLNALDDSNLTSNALKDYFGLSKKIKHSKKIPFSSQRKYSAVTFDKYGTFALGAPEFVLKDEFKTIQKQVNEYASKGYRVLLLGHKNGSIENEKLPEGETTIMSLILIEDNVRSDAIETISYFKKSGVEVKVISGDNPITVSKISERAGIVNADKYVSLDGVEDSEVIRLATKYTVFGRVSPDQKRLLIQTLRSEKKVVAMTGDGVNDILALKEADCSIAIASGSEAARNVSHLVLLDSNFGSMPKVVSEGRRVINNVSAVATLFLTKTIFSLLLALQALNSGGTYPITPSQLIMIDMLCIGIPSFVLVWEPNNKEVDGRFLLNILKGALPGAIVILLLSSLVFALVDPLNLNFREAATLIVILATHTCMMVLFKTCRPFNFMRKILCGSVYTAFILAVLILPNFFNFSPLSSIFKYYEDGESDTLDVISVENWLDVSISSEGNYVIDGYVTDYRTTSSTTSFNTTVTIDGYYQIRDAAGSTIVTNIPVHYPKLSIYDANDSGILSDSYFVLDGFVTEFAYSTDYEVSVDEMGYVYFVTTTGDTEIVNVTGYNILPTVKIVSGKYVINGVPTSIVADSKIDSVRIRTSDNALLVNDKVLSYYDTANDLRIYTVSDPIMSYDDADHAVLGGTLTQATLDQVSGDTDPTITCSTTIYLFNGLDLDVDIILPNVSITEKGHYIINGLYTEYIAESGMTSVLEQSVTEDGYYEINGIKTEYRADIKVINQGEVSALSLPALLLLLSTCLMAAPMMHILVGAIPWSKTMLKNIRKFITRT